MGWPALSYEHVKNVYKGNGSEARSQSPGQPSQPGSFEAALRTIRPLEVISLFLKNPAYEI